MLVVVLRTTMGRILAAGALVALAACSSAQAADGVVPEPIGLDLPGSETLAATAAARATTLCDTEAEPEPEPDAYRQETWAEVAELVGRTPLETGDGDTEGLALDRIRSGWQGDAALDEQGWDHTETASTACPDGHLYAVQVLARSPKRADAQAYGRVRFATDAVWHREGLRYGTAPDADGRKVDLLLDLFLPPATKADDPAGRPTLVLVHGGGFAGGSRSWHTEDAMAYARRGFVVATIDYRVDPDIGESRSAHSAAKFAAIDDAMDAVRWLRTHADEHGIDPDRIAALGASAGGEVALALALLEDLTPGGPLGEVSPKVTAAFSTGAHRIPMLRAAWLDASDAPVLLHHFETDTESGRSWTYASATCDAVRAAGGTCDLDITKGADHTVGLGPDSTEIDRILAFFAVHLRLDG